MTHNHLQLFVHFVWSTWDREPLIEDSWENSLFHEIHNEAARLGCQVLALNGTADHIHLLLKIPATIQICDIVKQIKGASSFFVNKTLVSDAHFKWQGNYSALTVSRWDVKRVSEYIKHQKTHHADNSTSPTFEPKPDP